AVITGAARGIGAATAAELSSRGATVVAADIDRAQLEQSANGSTCFPCDVRDPAHAEELVSFAIRKHGRVDVVVANAGIGYNGDFATMPTERLINVLDIN